MDEVYIDIRKENEWIRKYFTTDSVSIKQLLGCIEDLDGDIEELKIKIKELEYKEDEEEDFMDVWKRKMESEE